jgi:hypothetical protein
VWPIPFQLVRVGLPQHLDLLALRQPAEHPLISRDPSYFAQLTAHMRWMARGAQRSGASAVATN